MKANTYKTVPKATDEIDNKETGNRTGDDDTLLPAVAHEVLLGVVGMQLDLVGGRGHRAVAQEVADGLAVEVRNPDCSHKQSVTEDLYITKQ